MGIDKTLLRRDHFAQFKDAYFKSAKADIEVPINIFDEYAEFENVNPLAEGMRVIDEIIAILNRFRRHPLQVKMHDGMIKTCAKIFFGCDTVLKYDGVIRKKYGWANLKQEQLITAPRRFGKTQAVAMFICAFLLCKRNGEMAVFSTGGRASGIDTGMLKAVMAMLIGTLKIPKENLHLKDEHLTITMADDDVRRLHCYPASHDAYVVFCGGEQGRRTNNNNTGKFFGLWSVCSSYQGILLSHELDNPIDISTNLCAARRSSYRTAHTIQQSCNLRELDVIHVPVKDILQLDVGRRLQLLGTVDR